MSGHRRLGLSLSCAALLAACGSANAAPSAVDATALRAGGARPVQLRPLDTLALELTHRFIIADGHVDLPYRLHGAAKSKRGAPDVSQAALDGNFDYPRAKIGGLDAPFMSIYVPAAHEGIDAKSVADKLIDRVEGLAKAHPDKFALVRSPDDIRENFRLGKVSLPMGMENGSPLEGDLGNVEYFFNRGVRYITLAHSKDNHIADSSYDTRHTHGGLSPFGRKVVTEMNRVGIMVDVAHISDQAFDDILEVSAAPVMASHSSCRHFTPGFERNLNDEQIRRVAKSGGVVMINFGSSFLLDVARRRNMQRWEAVDAFMAEEGITDYKDPRVDTFSAAYKRVHPAPLATVEDVADHIDHVVALAGIDHVGLGSDFDGVGDSLPVGLRDVSALPNLFAVLIRRGYSAEDLEKIASGNLFRTWSAVSEYAAKSTPRP